MNETTQPDCKHCNGEGRTQVQVGSHWDVRYESCGFCDGSGKGPCSHPLVEVLSTNGRNLDNARRVCAFCNDVML